MRNESPWPIIVWWFKKVRLCNSLTDVEPLANIHAEIIALLPENFEKMLGIAAKKYNFGKSINTATCLMCVEKKSVNEL